MNPTTGDLLGLLDSRTEHDNPLLTDGPMRLFKTDGSLKKPLADLSTPFEDRYEKTMKALGTPGFEESDTEPGFFDRMKTKLKDGLKLPFLNS